MKKYLLALGISLLSAQAFAGCIALEYQEMKEMKTEDLIKEWCSVRNTINQNTADGIAALNYKRNVEGQNSNQESFDQCLGQSKRIARVLESKGVPLKGLLEKCTPVSGSPQ